MSRFPHATTESVSHKPVSSAARRLVKDPLRYKTIMCSNWSREGKCPYGFKCQFAHGKEELRERPTKMEPKAAPDVGNQQAYSSHTTVAATISRDPAEILGALSIAPAVTVPAGQHLTSPPPPLSMPAETDVASEPSPRLSGMSGATCESPNDHVAPLASAQIGSLSAPPHAKLAQEPSKVEDFTDGSGAQLVCNALTGEVEVALPPGAGRQVSHNTASVRRQISMLFEEELNVTTTASSAEVWGSGGAIIGAC